ncbi:bifunctional glutamate N-acetyltransferase/amino-acid acetyltransferase ArgJ [Gracilinema caldarium]|uniref:Arginine biosynthesis bifunctional protein ArgJ n=1 Tax=Gracilinema caldarium (strain ATCC 51460 / DSM 7334 / H1) TaxID=744872 RepID=F8F1I5_GRAC1|nr:bifunctional glutamate N-acetyltransferase/amino-acid acetyltransferase ArgJ [Gracilinema caldarium]AEJ19038.1 Arginine biosynthesis bifunctional protein ArgJ [Gracilinema caldarium DSM 7334]
MKQIQGGLCAPQGFRAGGVWCGIRKKNDKRDLALIVSDTVCTASGMYTTNKVKAASVLVTQEHLMKGQCQAIICNSGNANACTGEAGLDAARRMARAAGSALGIDPALVAVGSTGVIGVPLPVEKVEKAMPELLFVLSADYPGHSAALEAIMTTDTRKKEIALEFELDGKPVRIGAVAKGAGMIHPNMATMLSFITTDAAIAPAMLDSALRLAVRRSFNRVTVDGDTSTNDMVLILANGKAGNTPIEKDSANFQRFSAALEQVSINLARAIARDGEGATRLVTCTVKGAKDEECAEILAKSVVGSSLVKAACFGADANWGRILCAMGYSGADFEPDTVSVRFRSTAGEVAVCKGGASIPFSEELAKRVLSQEEIEILIDIINSGTSSATCWGCDLTYDYVKINGDYRS